MVQKSISISVIAAVVVAGILTLSVLAAISSTKQAFAVASPREEGSPSLSLETRDFGAGGKVGSAGTLHTQLYGYLTQLEEGSRLGIGGATIHITGTGEGKQFTVTTNEFGFYSTFADLAPGTHEIQAYFPGDGHHMASASATETVTVTS